MNEDIGGDFVQVCLIVIELACCGFFFHCGATKSGLECTSVMQEIVMI